MGFATSSIVLVVAALLLLPTLTSASAKGKQDFVQGENLISDRADSIFLIFSHHEWSTYAILTFSI